MIFKRGFKVNTCSFLNKIRTWWYDWWLKFSENFQKATPPFDTIDIKVDFAQISPNRLYVPLLKVWRTLRRLFSQVLGGKTQKQFSASKRKQVKYPEKTKTKRKQARHPEKTNDEGNCHDIKNQSKTQKKTNNEGRCHERFTVQVENQKVKRLSEEIVCLNKYEMDKHLYCYL